MLQSNASSKGYSLLTRLNLSPKVLRVKRRSKHQNPTLSLLELVRRNVKGKRSKKILSKHKIMESSRLL
jgi:hypothetical protein